MGHVGAGESQGQDVEDALHHCSILHVFFTSNVQVGHVGAGESQGQELEDALHRLVGHLESVAPAVGDSTQVDFAALPTRGKLDLLLMRGLMMNLRKVPACK